MSQQSIVRYFDSFDRRLTVWLERHSIRFLRIGLGIIFFWFGVLKFFPGLSPAQDLAVRTIATLTFGVIPSSLSLPLLAVLECGIGLGLITNFGKRVTLLLLFAQMVGTVLPLFFFTGQTFTHFPYAPTLEGQYIIKNIVLVSAGLVIGATVRGGQITEDVVDSESHPRNLAEK